MTRIASLLFVLTLIFPMAASAKYASQVAASYYNALKVSDYKAAASFYDRGALKEFRQMMSFIDDLPPKTSASVYQQLFGAKATKASVGQMNNVDYFAAFLEAIMTRAQAQSPISFDNLQIIGEVNEGASKVHVVTRNKVSAGQLKVEAMEVISLKKNGKRWRILMSGQIKGMAESIRGSLQR